MRKAIVLVAVLVAPAVIVMSESPDASHVLRIGIALLAAAIAFGAMINTKIRADKADPLSDQELATA